MQAEDGIRDLVRSRGLGDVYKRQSMYHSLRARPWAAFKNSLVQAAFFRFVRGNTDHAGTQTLGLAPVSYTHLTLPTSDLV